MGKERVRRENRLVVSWSHGLVVEFDTHAFCMKSRMGVEIKVFLLPIQEI